MTIIELGICQLAWDILAKYRDKHPDTLLKC